MSLVKLIGRPELRLMRTSLIIEDSAIDIIKFYTKDETGWNYWRNEVGKTYCYNFKHDFTNYVLIQHSDAIYTDVRLNSDGELEMQCLKNPGVEENIFETKTYDTLKYKFKELLK